MSRYDGKPLLKLLECYVLSSIDQLDFKQRNTLTLMEPKLSEIYGVGGTWYEIVHSVMKFPDSLPAKIYAVWESSLDAARTKNTVIDPNEFAITFVSQNFPAATS